MISICLPAACLTGSTGMFAQVVSLVCLNRFVGTGLCEMVVWQWCVCPLEVTMDADGSDYYPFVLVQFIFIH